MAESGEADALASAGAPDLALKLIAVSQPEFTSAPAAWIVWERKRLGILSRVGDYQAVYTEVSKLPAGIPRSFRRYALEIAAEAALAARAPERARRYLRRLIWTNPPPAAAALADYRELVIRSYVVGGELDDAARALDYLKRSARADDWRTRELAAEVALERSKPRAAERELASVKRGDARPLMLLAELGAGLESAEKIEFVAARLARDAEKRHEPQLAGRFRVVQARAATKTDHSATALAALMAALRLDPADAGVFRVSTADVWRALVTSGLAIGNSRELLLGDTPSWITAAKREATAGRPMEALALLAAAGRRSPLARERSDALAQFVRELASRPHGGELLLILFRDRNLFPDPARLPGAVRYALVDPAVQAGDTQFASELLTGLDKPPAGVSAGDWQLERARLFVLSGSTPGAVKLLQRLAAGTPPVGSDKLLAVVLDLETLGHDQKALSLLETMLATQPKPKLARELLYWIGKAYDDLGAPLNAARAYLESATYNSPYAMDQWAKTARYAAAASLTQAGDYADARRIYQGLLNATSDPTEQALIKERLAAVRTLATHRNERAHD